MVSVERLAATVTVFLLLPTLVTAASKRQVSNRKIHVATQNDKMLFKRELDDIIQRVISRSLEAQETPESSIRDDWERLDAQNVRSIGEVVSTILNKKTENVQTSGVESQATREGSWKARKRKFSETLSLKKWKEPAPRPTLMGWNIKDVAPPQHPPHDYYN